MKKQTLGGLFGRQAGLAESRSAIQLLAKLASAQSAPQKLFPTSRQGALDYANPYTVRLYNVNNTDFICATVSYRIFPIPPTRRSRKSKHHPVNPAPELLLTVLASVECILCKCHLLVVTLRDQLKSIQGQGSWLSLDTR